MIFSVAIILIVGVVAYFHYVQGFFSGTLSAILSVLAAALAISYHEPLSKMMMGGKFTDQATALSLLGIYVGVYFAGRTVLDRAVPGNIRLPVGFEKAGAAAMGLVAGIFSAGIIAIAAQAMPFGVAIAGYSRFATIDTAPMQIGGGRSGQMLDQSIHDVLKNDHLDPADASGLLLPADDIVLSAVKKLSDGGALAGTQNLAAIHPDFLTELFGQRLGVQVGAHHVAFNTEKEKQAELKGLFTIDSLPQIDGELTTMKGRWITALSSKVSSDAGKVIVIVRLQFARGASDSDSDVRVSTGGVRMVHAGKNYTPIGTVSMTSGAVLYAQRPDDFLLVPAEGIIDFAFYLSRGDFGFGDEKGKSLVMPDDVFVEAKRLGFIDLANQEISLSIPPPPAASILRKKGITAPAGADTAAAASSASAQSGPLTIGKVAPDITLFSEVSVGTIPADNLEVALRSGTVRLVGGKFSRMNIEPTDSLTLLKQNENAIRELYTPANKRIYRVSGSPADTTNDRWEWANRVKQWQLVDVDGHKYSVNGVVAKAKSPDGGDRMIARWDAEKPLDSFSASSEMRPTESYLYFVVPEEVKIVDLTLNSKVVRHLG